MQKKRILHLISGLEIGGAEMMLLKTLPKIQSESLENRVCCVRGHGPIGEALERQGVKVYYLELEGIFDIFAIKRFYKIIKNFLPDILVAYLIHAELYGRILGKLFGIKKIICSKRGVLLKWEWLTFFDKLTKKLVRHYLVQTEIAKKEWMDKLQLSENNFTIIPNGVDIKVFHGRTDNLLRKKRELGIKSDYFVISCVSKLRQGKGHIFLFKAFEEIFKKNKKILLLLVGTGEKEEELRNTISDYSSKNNILFLGDRDDVPEILAISDLFILPTEGEGMSNAILEAMASGLPIITTDLDVNKEIIENEKEGILVKPRNSNEIYQKLMFLIENYSERKRLGTNARNKALEKYDLRIIIKKTKSFLDNI